jgi:PAS domain S-box-containing protein
MTDAARKLASNNGPFPTGHSEMARRIRELDWSKTPLGPIDGWPQPLQTSVSTSLECAFPIVLWWGPELTILYNDEYRAFLGAKHPAALGQPGHKVWAEIWDVIAPMLSQVMQRAEATRSRDLLLHIDREGYPEEAYFSFSYSPIFDENGKVGGVFCPVLETTQRVIGERRLRTLRDLAAGCKGAESETSAYQRAATVLAANPQDVPFALIYRVDEAQSVALLEAAAGIEPGACAAPQRVALQEDSAEVWSLAAVARSGLAAVLTNLSDRFPVLPTGAWKISPHTALVLPVLLPGQERPRAILVAAVSPMRALDDDYRTFFGLIATQIASGLADAQALEEERRRAEALAELDRAKTAFFSNVSHEFRTPLTLILRPLEDALAQAPDDGNRDRLTLVHRNALRLQKLVNTLLDFSRIEAGRMQASYEPTDLSALTTELASVFRSAVEKAGLRLTVDCPPIPERIYVDRDMYEKIVLNLLSNAFKFTLEGGIDVALRDTGASVELSVRDTGTGIAADQLPRVFERFHRIEGVRARTHEGTGIGLALVQELAKLHGGTVKVQSVAGQGSTFTVTIPKGKAHLPADRIGVAQGLTSTALTAEHYLEEALRWLPDTGTLPVSSESNLPGALGQPATEHSPRPRIVWADDNADMRGYVSRLLQPFFDVEAVPDGEAALAAVKRQPPELVLADVMMPSLDGFGLLRALRKDERTRTIPVILLSARAGEEARVEGLQAGAADYLIKPFSARELLAHVQAHVEIARVRRETSEALRESATERRRAGEASARLAAIVESSDDAIVSKDLNGVIMSWNRGAERIFGYTAEEAIGQPITILMPPERVDEEPGILRRIRSGEKIDHYQTVRRRKDGTLLNMSLTVSPVLDGLGNIVGASKIARDITQTKRSEQRLRLLWESAAVLLRASDPDAMLRELFAKIGPELGLDAYFNYMLSDAGDALRMASCQGIPQQTAQSIARLELGQAVCGTVALQRKAIHATHIQQSDDPKVQLVKSFGIRAYACSPLLSADRLLGTLSFASRTRDEFEAEELAFMETICHYVTVAYERLRLLDQLKEADRRKDEFLATLAHELRNPLAPVRNSLHILRMARTEGGVPDRIHEMLDRQVNHMIRLVDDLMEISRITRGKIELRKERIELASVVRSAVETSKPLIEEAGHQLAISVPSEPLLLEADPVRLAQVLANLLNNAAKYTDRGGQIWLTVRRDNDHAVVSVCDTGAGIPANMLPKVFDLFTQVNRTYNRSQGGLGIGLTLVRRLVEMHGGTVEAKSDGDKRGSEFIVRLPLVPMKERPAAGPPRPHDIKFVFPKRILVVDDNKDSADSLAMMLKLFGAEVETAYDGPSALEIISARRPAVVLLDIGMPGMDGYEVARLVRGQPDGSNIALIALTGWGQQEERRRSQEAGINYHLLKPVDFDALQSLLASLLDKPPRHTDVPSTRDAAPSRAPKNKPPKEEVRRGD